MTDNNQIFGTILLLLAQACSGGNLVLRPSGSETSSDSSDRSKVAATSNRPRDEGVNPDEYNSEGAPIPISGTNLVEVLVSATCVSTQGAPVPTCKEVRLSAKVKVNDAKPVRFAADTLIPLGIKSSSWDIPAVAGVTCLSTEAGFAINPKCTSSVSLEDTVIGGTLTLVGADGSAFKGDAPKSEPKHTGNIFGNFMRLDAANGFTPTGKTAFGSTSAEDGLQLFTEIWQDLVSGLYLTNILYDGSIDGSIDWFASIDLCQNQVNSGDGTGVGRWHVPSAEELCGPGFASETCNGGLHGHGIMDVTFAGGSWGSAESWSSSTHTGVPSSAWYVGLGGGESGTNGKLVTDYSVFCVR